MALDRTGLEIVAMFYAKPAYASYLIMQHAKVTKANQLELLVLVLVTVVLV